MRTGDITTTLTAAQRAMGDVLCKIVLSDGTYTYGLDTTNRILDLRHPEQEWSQTAQVLVDNRDTNLTALTLEGRSAVISYGYHTTSDEYSATAPLEVIASKTDSMQGELVTTISLAGVFNMMGEDEASEAYTPEDTNGDTIKIILTAIANKTMACFSHCKSYTIVFDDEVAEEDFWAASLTNTFKPRDYFSVGFKESRLSAFKKALSYTGDKARVRADGYIHIFRPTTSGSTYDYEYNDAYGDYHNFFDKSVRKRLVIPNKVIVSSHPDHETQYTGNYADSDSFNALGRYIIEHIYCRPASPTQCTNIATAMIQNYQLARERGHGFAPMNVYQEVFDYVKITDSKVSDTAEDQIRIGNIGYLNRWYSAYPKQPTRFGFEFRFGSLLSEGLAGTIPPQQSTVRTVTERRDIQALYDQVEWLTEVYSSLDSNVTANRETILSIINYLVARQEVVPKLHVERQLIIPVWIPGAPLVTTQDASAVTDTTATGNGTITDLGVPNPTAHGVCWSTSTTPTVNDSVVDNGAVTETGAFTALIGAVTPLTASTTYYVRAYATNTTGTGYGLQEDFTTEATP